MQERSHLGRVLQDISGGNLPGHLEGQHLDFKEDRGKRDDVARSVSEAAKCFANASGGVIVVGVKDSVPGEEAFAGTSLDADWLRRRIHEMTEPGLVTEIEALTWRGRRLLVVRVPEGIEVHADKKGRATRRMGTDCVPMTPTEVAQLREERRGVDWSASPGERSLAGLDPIALAFARQQISGSPDPRRRALARLSDVDLLTALGVLDNSGNLLRAAEVLFVPQDGPQDSPHVVYQYRATPAGDPLAVERLAEPLVLVVGRVLDLIRARLNLTPLNLPTGEQLQLEDFPSLAVREALSNALVHRSYPAGGPVQIEHSPQVLVITSPGPLVAGVTPDNILTTPSRPRNPALASGFRLLGFAEETGRGVDRMYREMIRAGKTTPSIDNRYDSVRVTLVGGAPNTQIARYVATLPEQERDDTDAMLVLFQLCSHQAIDALSVSVVLQKTAEETETVLRRLAGDGVAMIEPTRQTARRANPKYRLRASTLQALGTAVPYRRRTADDIDRKVIAHVREYGKITNQTIRNLFDVEMHRAKAILSDLTARELLIKTSQHQRGPRVEYGPGRKFPRTKEARRTRAATDQESLDI